MAHSVSTKISCKLIVSFVTFYWFGSGGGIGAAIEDINLKWLNLGSFLIYPLKEDLFCVCLVFVHGRIKWSKRSHWRVKWSVEIKCGNSCLLSGIYLYSKNLVDVHFQETTGNERLFITMLHFFTRNIQLSKLNLNVNSCQALWEAGNGGHAPLKFHLIWKPVHNRFWSRKNQPVLLWQLHLFFWKIKLKMAKELVNIIVEIEAVWW